MSGKCDHGNQTSLAFGHIVCNLTLAISSVLLVRMIY